jgi:hypothetical protein
LEKTYSKQVSESDTEEENVTPDDSEITDNDSTIENVQATEENAVAYNKTDEFLNESASEPSIIKRLNGSLFLDRIEEEEESSSLVISPSF